MQVWQAIYKDNCMLDRFQDIDVQQTCSEQTLLFQLVSGLHTSINMHVSMNFVDPALKEQVPNYPLFLRTIGWYPARMKNLYFLYALVLKALNRAEASLVKHLESLPQEKQELFNIMNGSRSDCQVGDLFNETYFFMDEQQTSPKLSFPKTESK
jgi:hypothetical protein